VRYSSVRSKTRLAAVGTFEMALSMRWHGGDCYRPQCDVGDDAPGWY
jgi:hypothetical protein